MKTIRDLLAEHTFFKDLDEHHLELLAGCGKNIHWHKDQIVLHIGDEADYFYLIRSGNVALEIAGAQLGPIRIQTVETGDILGWSWLIPPHIWRFNAVAVDETSAIALDGRCLRAKCEDDHELGYELLKRFSTVLSSRLESTRLQLLDVYGAHDTPEQAEN